MSITEVCEVPEPQEYFHAWGEALTLAGWLKEMLQEMVALPADGAGLDEEPTGIGEHAGQWSDCREWQSLHHNTLRGLLYMADLIRSELECAAPGEVQEIVRDRNTEEEQPGGPVEDESAR